MPIHELFRELHALEFQQLSVLIQPAIERHAHLPGSGKHFRVFDGDFIGKGVRAEGRVALDHMQGVAMKIPGPVKPSLVVDVTAMNDQTWFDRAGNFHSDALHVVERYTPLGPDALTYEATIEDPNVFSRPWKMSMPLYRRLEKNAQLFEFKCVEFAEELMYGHLRKQPSK